MTMLQRIVEDRLVKECELGNLDKFKKILNDKTFNIDINKNIDNLFSVACRHNKLNIVEYLYPKLVNKDIFQNLSLFKAVCVSGSDEVLGFFLEKIKKEDLTKRYHFNHFEEMLNEGYKGACLMGRLQVIKKLEKFKLHNFTVPPEEGLFNCLSQIFVKISPNELECINHFLYDLKLPVDESLKYRLSKIPHGENILIEASIMCSKRDLFFKMNETLVEDETLKQKKNKI